MAILLADYTTPVVALAKHETSVHTHFIVQSIEVVYFNLSSIDPQSRKLVHFFMPCVHIANEMCKAIGTRNLQGIYA